MADIAAVAYSPAATSPTRSPWQDAWLRLRCNHMAMLGLAVIVMMALAAIAADWIAPIPFTQQDASRAYEAPVRSTGWELISSVAMSSADSFRAPASR